MKVKITYPEPVREKLLRQKLINAAKWPFLFAAYICPIINIFTGGKAWSVIVVWSLWFVWSSVISPSLVEYNRISQTIKLITNACILLILIDFLLSSGLLSVVVPSVCSGGLFVAGLLFFTDIDRQAQNMMPMLLLGAVSVICAIISIPLLHGAIRIAPVIMGALALALLTGCFLTLGQNFMRELKKRFHTK